MAAYTCVMAAGAQDYLVFDLGSLEEGESSWAYGISNLNDIVGESHVDYPTKQAFIWLPAAETTWNSPFNVPGMIGLGGGANSVANKINDDSVVVGTSGAGRAFMWQPTGIVPQWSLFQVHILPDVTDGLGITKGNALDFESDPLRIIGSAWIEDGELDSDQVGFLWRSDAYDSGSVILDGPVSAEDQHFRGFGISPHTQTGAGETSEFGPCGGGDCPFYGLEWNLSVSTTGTRLAALPDQTDSGRALDASDGGLLVGQLLDEAVSKQHAVVWHWDGAAVFDLHDGASPALGSDQASIARAIRNNLLEIVGANVDSNDAMLWFEDPDEQTDAWYSVDLNTTIVACGWSLIEANDINERGWIVGSGVHSGVVRGFVLVPRDRPCRADVSGVTGVPDGYVDTSDLLAVLAAWGECAEECDQCQADTDDDWEVGVSDLLAVLAAWSDERFACDGSGDVPRSIQDCIEKIGYGNPEALAACIEFVMGGS